MKEDREMTLEGRVAEQLSEIGAPADLAPQLVAIAAEFNVPDVALLAWIRHGSPSITGAAWLCAARTFSEEHKDTSISRIRA